MAYSPPLKDMRFVLKHIVGIDDLSQLPGYDHATPDVIDAVLEEAAKLASEVWAPTNASGDRQTSKISNNAVKTPDGFKNAYTKFYAGGWNALVCNQEHGGQGLPWALGMAVGEMWQSANLALSLCPLLTQAAIEAIEKHGTEEQKKLYLEKLISGVWTGAMCLTEPQAGTDLAAIRTVAKKNGDHYVMKGQKIFITWGEHDFTDNIIHLVLARVDGLPEGNDGLGLFIVPKFMVGKDGSIGKRNDMKAVSLEHKLGIHGSPTCVMVYGENEGAVCYLVGEEGKGLRNMFTMMNNARISVGLQGVAVAEAAYQHAMAYAKDRVQGSQLGDKSGKRVPIIEHADVRRMLMTMKANTEAARALAYYAGGMIDRMRREVDPKKRAAAAAQVELLTPIVKAWSTDLAVETTSTGVQIHGGMGFIEETGAAQYYRDARILPIYEGTNGIQASDLLFRKVLRDKGAEAYRLLTEIKMAMEAYPQKRKNDVIASCMKKAVTDLEEATTWLLGQAEKDPQLLAATAVPYLRMFSLVMGGYMMAQMALAAHQAILRGENDSEHHAKLATARFYAETILPQVSGLMVPVMGGYHCLSEITNDQF